MTARRLADPHRGFADLTQATLFCQRAKAKGGVLLVAAS